ncbi:class I SAM-dependent methyltransferase [Bradyrhizobium sp.]|jgi:2-polyprenyl-6-hydroxyphenyl methylase/3-demethylubiquinone-9 3-methyltransferase|uniref:class I SAM-dependent methyltransferase n=1 Tax=Bradyrhizobium sp. TaxID=376 RepID=UPI002E03CBA2|nr:class I SAM-dependent methyltransferase [Bradyrhizobium sp.]
MNNPSAISTSHRQEIGRGERFEFGDNWAHFLSVVDDERISRAEAAIKQMLEVEDLKGKTFLDVGSGSGLSSLAARRLGARVFSFDYDPQSVACTVELKRRYFEADPSWTVEEGSALNADYLARLGKFDVVYSWGVLHHTGAMWDALANVAANVSEGGKLFIALYNDQGRASKAWWIVKKAYVSLPKPLRFIVVWPCLLKLWGPATIRDLVFLQPFSTWINYKKNRGMSPYRDVIDWVGGFPFEVCKPEEVFDFYKSKGFELTRLSTCAGGIGCNEFVFERKPVLPGDPT